MRCDGILIPSGEEQSYDGSLQFSDFLSGDFRRAVRSCIIRDSLSPSYIFQMMTALTDIEFTDTGLSKDARYFMSSDLDSAKGQQFRDGFRDTVRAMDMLGFTKDQKKDIFQVLSLLIHMSNIRFTQEDDHCKIDTDDERTYN